MIVGTLLVTASAALCALADTNAPFQANEKVFVVTATKTVKGVLKDSATKDWIHVLDAAGTDVWIPVRAVELMARQKPGGESAAPPQADLPPPAMRYIVYVHGICKHDPNYSLPWWNSLKHYVSDTPDDHRKEVLWSDLVTAPTADLPPTDHPVTRELKDDLRDRADRQQMSVSTDENADLPPAVMQAIPDIDCIDGFTLYLMNPQIRSKVIGRFTDVVRPLLLMSNVSIEIISHSWGTVIAYQGLRTLEGDPQIKGTVHNLFSVGSALSIGAVKRRLLPIAIDGKRPKAVQRWVNINARFDVVGGPMMARPYAVDVEVLNTKPVGCSSLIPNPVCSHGSYFVMPNVAVNRDIFALYIGQ
jgi:hypothetical protein